LAERVRGGRQRKPRRRREERYSDRTSISCTKRKSREERGDTQQKEDLKEGDDNQQSFRDEKPDFNNGKKDWARRKSRK